MMASFGRFLSALLYFGLTLVVGLAAQDKKLIEKRDDLPRYTYRIETTAVELLKDRSAYLELARAVKKDLQADLDQFQINDKTTLQEFYANLGTIALLEGRWDDYLSYLGPRKELEDKEATRLTMGMVGELMARGLRDRVTDLPGFLRQELQAKIEAMPYKVVEASLKSSKGSSEIISESLVLGSIESGVQPMLDASGGEMSREVATQLIGAAYTLAFFLPVKETVRDVLTDFIDAQTVEKKDIWAERDFSLRLGEGKEPVVLAVWDSGVDAGIFAEKGTMWINRSEVPDNGLDDDQNGYVDDVHGIAYSLHADKESELLRPLGEFDFDEVLYRRYVKGLTDIQASVDSKEASELKQKLAGLERSEVKPFIESVNLYAAYAHGTHVSGIAASGNPLARILAARLTFDHRMIPETPTVEQANKDARMLRETVEYFRQNGVRVVNMSWGGSIRMIEDALEKNNAGGSPEERKKLARKIFRIGDEALREAIQGAPDILFVTSAGNADSDVRFDEFLPSSYDFPNILSIGAVDQAGDETSFTSFGKVDVYANGFEVMSYVPGGERMKMSGTSMSAPQVMNLAGKLLAVKPDLTVEQLRQVILDGADEKAAGDRTVLLLNPRKSLELVVGRSGG